MGRKDEKGALSAAAVAAVGGDEAPGRKDEKGALSAAAVAAVGGDEAPPVDVSSDDAVVLLPSMESDNVDEPPMEASGDNSVVPPPSLEADVVTDDEQDEQPAPEADMEQEQLEAPSEAARLKALKAMLFKEIMEKRAQVATLTARIEELSIAPVGTDEDSSTQQSALSVGDKKAAEYSSEVEKVGKKPAKKKPAKKAPARAARDRKVETTGAAAPPDQGGMPANASVAGHELEAGPDTGGRSRRIRKPNSLYSSDIWVL